MLKTQGIILDSWQDASQGGGRRLTRLKSFDGSDYTVVGLPSPARGGPTTGTFGTLVFLPGEGEYQHVVTCIVFTAASLAEVQAMVDNAPPAPPLPPRTKQVAVLTAEQAKEAAAARSARRLANNQLQQAEAVATSEVAPA